MKSFRAKPIWYGTPDPLVAGQWTPAPHWATHILKSQTGDYTWAEQFGDLWLGEPRYRGGTQSRDCITVGPDAWQVVEARPAPMAPSAADAWNKVIEDVGAISGGTVQAHLLTAIKAFGEARVIEARTGGNC